MKRALFALDRTTAAGQMVYVKNEKIIDIEGQPAPPVGLGSTLGWSGTVWNPPHEPSFTWMPSDRKHAHSTSQRRYTR